MDLLPGLFGSNTISQLFLPWKKGFVWAWTGLLICSFLETLQDYLMFLITRFFGILPSWYNLPFNYISKKPNHKCLLSEILNRYKDPESMFLLFSDDPSVIAQD